MKKGPYIAVICVLLAVIAVISYKYVSLLHSINTPDMQSINSPDPVSEAAEGIAEVPSHPVSSVTANPDSDPNEFYEVLRQASETHKAAVTAPIDASALKEYCKDDPETDKLLSDEEINALRDRSPRSFDVSHEEAECDVRLLFKALRSSYCAYFYFGEERFEQAEENILSRISGQTTVQCAELENLISEEMQFAADAHAVFGVPFNEDAVRYRYYYADGVYFNRENDKYFMDIDNGSERLTLEGFSDERVTVELTLAPDGSFVYSPVLFCPASEVTDCEAVFINTAGEKTEDHIVWTQGHGLAEPVMRPEINAGEVNGVAYISVRSFMRDFDNDLQGFMQSGEEFRNSKLIIFDLRGNHGGDDRYAAEWVRRFSGSDPAYTLAVGNRASRLRSAMFGDSFGKNGCFDLFEQSGEFIANDIPIIVLVDDGCASSGESMLNFLKTLDNTLVIGMNSGGYQLCGNEMEITLPNTGISAYFGVSLTFPYTMESVDYRGYKPDVWCSADNGLASILNMLVRYGLADTETAVTIDELYNVKHDNITPGPGFGPQNDPVQQESDLTLSFMGCTIFPGGGFGSGNGSHFLDVFSNGMRVEDYTYSIEDNGVLSHFRTRNGRIGVSVIGNGDALITVTRGDQSASFIWHSEGFNGNDAGFPEDSEEVLIDFAGEDMLPGMYFGSPAGTHVLAPMLNGEYTDDYELENLNPEIINAVKMPDGSISVDVVGAGDAKLVLNVHGKPYVFWWAAWP